MLPLHPEEAEALDPAFDLVIDLADGPRRFRGIGRLVHAQSFLLSGLVSRVCSVQCKRRAGHLVLPVEPGKL